jgi:antirestriction protein ArdC
MSRRVVTWVSPRAVGDDDWSSPTWHCASVTRCTEPDPKEAHRCAQHQCRGSRAPRSARACGASSGPPQIDRALASSAEPDGWVAFHRLQLLPTGAAALCRRTLEIVPRRSTHAAALNSFAPSPRSGNSAILQRASQAPVARKRRRLSFAGRSTQASATLIARDQGRPPGLPESASA